MQSLFTSFQNSKSLVTCTKNQACNLSIDLLGRTFTYLTLSCDFLAQEHHILGLIHVDGTKLRHSPLGNHASGRFSSHLDILASATGFFFKNQQFCSTSTHHNRQAFLQILSGNCIAILCGQLHSKPKRHSSWNNRHFVQRVRTW